MKYQFQLRSYLLALFGGCWTYKPLSYPDHWFLPSCFYSVSCPALNVTPKHGVSLNWALFWVIVSFMRASPVSYSHGQHSDSYFPNIASDRSVNLGAIRANQYGGMSDHPILFISWNGQRSFSRTILVYIVKRDYDRLQVFPSTMALAGGRTSSDHSQRNTCSLLTMLLLPEATITDRQ